MERDEFKKNTLYSYSKQCIDKTLVLYICDFIKAVNTYNLEQS